MSQPSVADIAKSASMKEGPVATLVLKRLRAAKKKLNKIEEIEAKLADGKTINADQEEVLKGRPGLVAVIDELEKLTVQLKDAVKDETTLAAEAATVAAEAVRDQVIAERIAERIAECTAEWEEKAAQERSTFKEQILADSVDKLVSLMYFGQVVEQERHAALQFDQELTEGKHLEEQDLLALYVLSKHIVGTFNTHLSHKDRLEHGKEWALKYMTDSEDDIEFPSYVAHLATSPITVGSVVERVDRLLQSKWTQLLPTEIAQHTGADASVSAEQPASAMPGAAGHSLGQDGAQESTDYSSMQQSGVLAAAPHTDTMSTSNMPDRRPASHQSQHDHALGQQAGGMAYGNDALPSASSYGTGISSASEPSISDAKRHMPAAQPPLPQPQHRPPFPDDVSNVGADRDQKVRVSSPTRQPPHPASMANLPQPPLQLQQQQQVPHQYQQLAAQQQPQPQQTSQPAQHHHQHINQYMPNPSYYPQHQNLAHHSLQHPGMAAIGTAEMTAATQQQSTPQMRPNVGGVQQYVLTMPNAVMANVSDPATHAPHYAQMYPTIPQGTGNVYPPMDRQQVNTAQSALHPTSQPPAAPAAPAMQHMQAAPHTAPATQAAPARPPAPGAGVKTAVQADMQQSTGAEAGTAVGAKLVSALQESSQSGGGPVTVNQEQMPDTSGAAHAANGHADGRGARGYGDGEGRGGRGRGGRGRGRDGGRPRGRGEFRGGRGEYRGRSEGYRGGRGGRRDGPSPYGHPQSAGYNNPLPMI